MIYNELCTRRMIHKEPIRLKLTILKAPIHLLKWIPCVINTIGYVYIFQMKSVRD